MNILFVCTGNRYRSQAAWAMAKKILHHRHKINSAGVSEDSAKRHAVPKRLRKALKKMGYDPEWIPSKKVTKDMLECQDNVIYMQPSHWEFLQKFPEAKGKLISFAQLCGYARSVPDLAFVHDKRKFKKVLKAMEGGIYRLQGYLIGLELE